jgi:NADPH:quinone reductase-like Zn-dependent oxidoreductase
MKAAILREYGVPEFGDWQDEPVAGPGQAVVEVGAAGLNPVDVAIASGRFYGGQPPLPSIAGREGVGRLDDGRRIYFDSPVPPFGSMAERTLVEAGSGFEVPNGVEDGVAVALGIAGLAAWLALEWRAKVAPGEHVLVLGATGAVGQIAVQGAKLLGAGRVVGAGRDAEALVRVRGLGADATVATGDNEDVPAALKEAAEDRIDIVVDPLWGAPLVAAVQAASFGARIVQLGAAAGPETTLPSAPIRGKMLVLMGHTNFATPPEVKAKAYASMARAAAAGDLQVDLERVPLERVADAFRRQAESPHHKLVLVP